MKRKVCGVMVLAVMLFALTGCRMYADYVVNNDGTVTSSGVVAYTEEELEIMSEEEKAQATLKTLESGKQYYVVEQEPQTKSMESVKEEDGLLITRHMCFFELGEYNDTAEGERTEDEASQEGLYMQLSVTLKGKIVSTNGQVSEDGTKVTFNTKDNGKEAYWYAYTAKGQERIEKDKAAPKMKGAKNNKYYKKMPTNITFVDNIAVKEVKLNGKIVTPVSVVDKSDGKEIKATAWFTSQGKSAAKNGKNVFKVKDLNDNVSVFTIYVDGKKPVIKGVKENKTYKNKAVVYVKDAVQLKTIKINGKAQNMGKKQLVKSGKYKGYYKYVVKKKGANKIVVTDMAGQQEYNQN